MTIAVHRAPTTLRFATLLLALGCLLLASCGGSRTPADVAAPAPPSVRQTQWLSLALGATPAMSFVARPTAARSDPYWGPLVARVLQQRDNPDDFISHFSGGLLLGAQQIDLHIAERDPVRARDPDAKIDPGSWAWLGFLYGLGPLDPLSLRMGSGARLFSPPTRLSPSGVIAFAPDPGYLRRFGAIAPTLFVTTDGTYVLADQGSAPRVRELLERNGYAPPPTTIAPDAIGGVRSAVASLRFVSPRSRDRAGITQGMVAASFGIRGGENGALEGYADYATSDDAARGYAALQRSCAHRRRECLIDPSLVRDATAEREGSRVFVSLKLSDAALQSLQNAFR